MIEYYNVVSTIENYLKNNISVNTVSLGPITDIDFDKQTVYPLSNIDINKVSFEGQFMIFEVQVFCLDIVDTTKEETHSLLKPIYGNNNLHDVYNTQLSVVNGLQSSLRRGELNYELYEVGSLDVVEANQVSYQGVNLLAGWEVTLSISLPNVNIKAGIGNTC